MSASSPVLVNGELVDANTAAISVWDLTVQRGDGFFDIIYVDKNAEGKILLVGLDLHFVRMFRCAEQMLYKIEQSREQLEQWMRKIAELGGPGKIRMLFTRGMLEDNPGVDGSKFAPKSVIILWHPHTKYKIPGTLLPMEFPWSCYHSNTSGAMKWMSYGPNMLMTRMAVKEGYNDALLTSHDGHVLEGPTFSIIWLKNGEIFTSSVKQMKILPSITATIVMTILQNIGYKINIGKYLLKEVLEADEVFTTSATRLLIPVEKIGDRKYSIEQGMKLREIVSKGILERENWISQLTSPYDFPLNS
ncbi:hypothetical protein LOD99_7207 [Oopsacas minuta]|uniref:Branched-chain-amino-acid aminotransferase n=1 Tax=Oopsacas minuta TaxID=111878 RepID=A0AAV7JUE1_9METZ|nr:hypothetical protein LOD99_7207 [Oopsacas minuta]